jgi:hypothetical protein
MTEKKYLLREKSPTGAWRFKLDLVKWEPGKIQRALSLPATQELQKINSFEMFTALEIFAKGHKRPKFIETGAYTHYGQTIGGLFKHAIETSYGAAPSRDELRYYRDNLQQYASQLEAHLKGVNAILDTEEIWDPHQTTVFLLQGISNTDHIKELAEKAIKENQK